MINIETSDISTNEIYFAPLGGGQNVGASCYYLRLGDSNIILDAGMGKKNGLSYEPDFHNLLKMPFIQSMKQIDQIYISHAHADHVGYLTKLMKQANYAGVYMTEITKLLSEYQLYDRNYLGRIKTDEDERLATKALIDKINKVCFMQTVSHGYKATFFPAGHIPGAMMILFEIGDRKILYTGDYSIDSTLLTGGCLVPKNMNIDTVVMCGLHAKQPNYKKSSDTLTEKAKKIINTVEKHKKSVKCVLPQLSKGIEFLKALNEANHEINVPIYVDPSILNMVSKMEKLSIPILDRNNKSPDNGIPRDAHIYITSDASSRGFGCYEELNVDFSLHEDFSDMKKFIKDINPKKVVLVHCGKEDPKNAKTIENEFMFDMDCSIKFIFANEGEIYRL